MLNFKLLNLEWFSGPGSQGPEAPCPEVVLLLHHADKNVVTERANTTLLNLNFCTNFKTRHRVPGADLRLPRLLGWRSL